MTQGSCFHRNKHHNFLPINSNNNELANAPPKAPTKSNDSIFTLLVFFHTPTLGPTSTLTSNISISKYTDKDLQKVLKFTLMLFFQAYKQAQN